MTDREVLKKMYQLLLTEPHAPTVCEKMEAIAKEALAQPPLPVQETSALTRPCRSCGGTGERFTGIDEAPTSICKPCNGTGQIALAQPAQEPVKLWLWENFVDGKPEYWAFDNPFPIFMDSHDPQTLGEPCGYAWLKPSRTGRTDVSDEQALQAVQKALAQPPLPVQEPVREGWKLVPLEPTQEMVEAGTGQGEDNTTYWMHPSQAYRAMLAAVEDRVIVDRALQALTQPAQEPVAHLWECLGRWSAYLAAHGEKAEVAPPSWLVDAINKATTPPAAQRQPLTNEQLWKNDGIMAVNARLALQMSDLVALTRAIETAHTGAKP